MSKKDKLAQRLLSKPKDFSYQELIALLLYFSYKEDNVGKTSGSAVRFINEKTGHAIRIHKPHPDSVLKAYVVRTVVYELRKEGYLK
ncbi:MAG: type II toxin-antitoxin system HicA family toxin [Oscillospiraceae bacterium]|nr:type II toxin-antitoxin system HicA family toxin [Oscillospiraceae bacterium]